jgi:hypothetical protein
VTDILADNVEISRHDGTKVLLHSVHILEPDPWSENPEGLTEDYYVIQEANAEPALIRVSARSPFRLEQLDLSTSRGVEYWKRVEPLIAKSGRG